jgi:hypothetical protein
MDFPKIRPVAPWLVVTPVCREMEIRANPSAKMAVLAGGLIMAINAVVGILLSGYSMLGVPEAQMRRCHPLAFVALVTFLDR